MSFIITVSQFVSLGPSHERHRHLFSTADHSITSERHLKEVYGQLTKTYPEADGHRVSVMEKQTIGKAVIGYPY